MENEVNFDALARKANESGGAAEDIENLSRQIFALPEWLFIARGDLPNVNPYIASNAGYADGRQMISVFTDSDRLQRFVKENNLLNADGSTQMLTVPVSKVVDYLEQFIADGADGVWFNSNQQSDGFFFPLKQLRSIKNHLGNLNLEMATSAAPDQYSNLENWGLHRSPNGGVDLNLKIAEEKNAESASVKPPAPQNASPHISIRGQTFQLPDNRIEVKFGRVQDAALLFLVIFFGGLSVLFLFNGIAKLSTLLIVFFLGLILAAVCFLVIRAKRKAVRLFDKDGIRRGDGRRFSWNDFQGTVKRIGTNRYGGKGVWRVELKFAGGEEAWIIPQRVKNYAEVFEFVDKLPAAILK